MMPQTQIRQLPHKPLVEAILEIRWQLADSDWDPRYPIFVGSLFEKIKTTYPYHEALPTSNMPRAIPYVAQHRFRASQNEWPLVQVGLGLITLNDTANYSWQDFGARANALAQNLFETYPEPSQLILDTVALHYVNALEVGSNESDLFAFMDAHLKTSVALPDSLFDKASVASQLHDMHLQFSFPLRDPKGEAILAFRSGTKNKQPILIWEMKVQSTGTSIAAMPDRFPEWIEGSHTLLEDWFFKFIEGKLERRFFGDE